MKLTADILRDLIHYDPQTGVFTWARSRVGCRKGDECGRINTHGYREIGVLSKLRPAGHLAYLYMTGEWPPAEIDHENHDTADNRWKNLRPASRKQNAGNQPLRVDNKSGISGVVWDTLRHKWRAQLRINGRRTNLGRFDDKVEAMLAVRFAALREWGEFTPHGVFG